MPFTKPVVLLGLFVGGLALSGCGPSGGDPSPQASTPADDVAHKAKLLKMINPSPSDAPAARKKGRRR
jgi:hypothetical protein